MAYRQKEYNYNDKLTKDQNLLMDKLYKMRMSGMAEAFENQLMNPNSGLESFETRFSEIINHEWSGRENVTDLMSCHGFAHMNCHQIDWFSVISQPHRAAA